MPVQPIDPVSDPRVEHKTAQLNGQTYHYLYAVPKSGEYTHTVFLVSGVWWLLCDASKFRTFLCWKGYFGVKQHNCTDCFGRFMVGQIYRWDGGIRFLS